MQHPPRVSFKQFNDWRRSALPLTLEIGCGVGYHPIQWAKAHQGRQILAIERTSEKFAKFERRLFSHPQLQKQIFAAHADASFLLPHLLATGSIAAESISECFWLYPNPEPKKRKHRIAFSKLTDLVVSTIKLGGRLTIATNIETYAKEVLYWLSQKHSLKLESADDWSIELGFRSHFEKKYLERGDRCFNLQFLKRQKR